MGSQQHAHAGQGGREAVLSELERVCESEAFRHSRQSVKILRYLVEQSLQGNEEALRERAIGAVLFGRDPKYDTNEDSIVRVSATEVRKRLARYNHEAGEKAAVVFSIPTGSYRVEFQPGEQGAPAPAELPGETSAETQTAARKGRAWTRWTAAGLVFAAIAAGTYAFWPASSLDRFWAPATKDSASVVILAPHPIVYTFSRETFKRFRGDTPSHAQRQIEVLKGPADAMISLSEVVPIQDQYIGLGSAHAISNVSALLAVRKKQYTIRFGGDFSFQDIRHSPAVLVGAYANRWTLQLTEDFRFALSESGGLPEITDRRTGKSWQLKKLQPNGKTPEDYVIVSRLFHPKTGKLVIALAGITQYGTQAAGEFVTDAGLLEQGLKDAPKGWEGQNVQFVLHVPIVEGVPGRPEVVAANYW